MTTSELALEILKVFDRFNVTPQGGTYKITTSAFTYFKHVDFVELMFRFMCAIDSTYEQFEETPLYAVETAFGGDVLALMTAAFYGTPEKSDVMHRYFEDYGEKGDEARFWQHIKLFVDSYPSPYQRLKTILFILYSGGELRILGDLD